MRKEGGKNQTLTNLTGQLNGNYMGKGKKEEKRVKEKKRGKKEIRDLHTVFGKRRRVTLL